MNRKSVFVSVLVLVFVLGCVPLVGTPSATMSTPTATYLPTLVTPPSQTSMAVMQTSTPFISEGALPPSPLPPDVLATNVADALQVVSADCNDVRISITVQGSAELQYCTSTGAMFSLSSLGNEMPFLEIGYGGSQVAYANWDTIANMVDIDPQGVDPVYGQKYPVGNNGYFYLRVEPNPYGYRAMSCQGVIVQFTFTSNKIEYGCNDGPSALGQFFWHQYGGQTMPNWYKREGGVLYHTIRQDGQWEAVSNPHLTDIVSVTVK